MAEHMENGTQYPMGPMDMTKTFLFIGSVDGILEGEYFFVSGRSQLKLKLAMSEDHEDRVHLLSFNPCLKNGLWMLSTCSSRAIQSIIVHCRVKYIFGWWF